MSTEPNPPTLASLSDLFEALSDPTRLAIISMLVDAQSTGAGGEMGVGEMVSRLGLSKSAVSHQLRGLHDRRIIKTRKVGRNVTVSLDDEHVRDLFLRGLEHVKHD